MRLPVANQLTVGFTESNIGVEALLQMTKLSILNARKRVKGFAGINKLRGPAAHLFINAVSSMLDGMNDDVGNETPEEYPLFSMLSPHHRLCLLSEVIIGLLDETAPLPPDTLEHFSTYYAIYDYAYTKIEMEIDDAYFNREWRREERGDVKTHDTKKTAIPRTLESLLNQSHSTLEAGRQFDAQERTQLKRIGKTLKTLPDLDQSDLKSATVNRSSDSSRDWLDRLHKSCDFDVVDDDDIDFEDEDFHWRKLLHETFFEDVSFVPFKYRSMDIEKWRVWYPIRLACVGIVPHNDDDEKLMFGALRLDQVRILIVFSLSLR